MISFKHFKVIEGNKIKLNFNPTIPKRNYQNEVIAASDFKNHFFFVTLTFATRRLDRGTTRMYRTLQTTLSGK